MNSERGIDGNTDFQRSYVIITDTDKKSSLLKNKETNELVFSEIPIVKEGYSNFHLHLLFPVKDQHTGKNNSSINGHWSIESLVISKWRNEQKVGPYLKPVLFNSEIHSSNCSRILASTANLKYVDKICNSLIEAYVTTQGKLKYVMVQPFYDLYPDLLVDGESYNSVSYKKDFDGYIAIFPAIAYNKARLENQWY